MQKLLKNNPFLKFWILFLKKAISASLKKFSFFFFVKTNELIFMKRNV